MAVADSHAHLSMKAFDEDLPEVLSRARGAGVADIMTCATSLADASKNLEIARREKLRASVGFHPHQASEWSEESPDGLRSLIGSSDTIAAIGEIGLDFHYNFSPPDVQREVLRSQIALARSVRLPLIIHCRNASDDLRAILVEERARDVGGVLHCFSEDAEFARFCLDLGFHVSFSGIITFKNAESVRSAAAIVPIDRILVETDSPYLSPVPHRGRRNEPAHVADVARFVSGLKGIDPGTFGARTVENFRRLFGSSG